jgi:hypothetical protein
MLALLLLTPLAASAPFLSCLLNTCAAEVLAVYEDEVVLLQEQLLQQGAERGLPGLKYQLAELQVRQRKEMFTAAVAPWHLRAQISARWPGYVQPVNRVAHPQ